MRVYISGPMTGIEAHNYPAFHAAVTVLAEAGHEPINPARHPECDSWEAYMRLDLADVLTAEGVALLPGHRESRGARLETLVAHQLGLDVRPLDEWVTP